MSGWITPPSGSSVLDAVLWEDCSVEGKEIHSTSLKCLNTISCKFVDGFRVFSSKVVSLRFIRPSGYIPRIQNMEVLVTATIVHYDPCLLNDRRWLQKESQKDEPDEDDGFFAHAGSEDSDDSSFAHSAAEESDDNNRNESDDRSNYYDSDWSGPSDDEENDCIVCCREIADENKKKPYRYLINGNNRSACGPRADCTENFNLW